ncbi:MAG: DUF4358 domain-containing protein [Eubacteriales bacterium]
MIGIFRKKITAAVLCILCLANITLMTACGGKDSGTENGTDENRGEPVTMEQVYEAVSAVLPDSETLIDAQESYLSGFFGGAVPEDFASYKIVMQSMSTSIDNVGIFEAKTKDDVKKIEKMIDTFLDFYENEVWDDTYLEDEYPKLRDAERVTGGNFVMYVILDDDARAAAVTAFENATK